MKIVKTAFVALATLTCFNMTSLTGPKAAYGFDNSAVWMVTQFNNEVITNLDVHDYIDAMMTSDMEVLALMKSSKNYDDYYKKNFEIKKSQYEEGLKRMLLSRLLERDAIRKDKRKNYFRITQSAFTNRINERESEILREFLDKKIGIVKAREEYGNLLLSQGILKKNERETATDVYMRFFEREKRRIKEGLREDEARKYQIGEAYKTSLKLPLSYLAHDDFSKATSRIIEANLNHKFTTQDKVNEVMKKNPDVGVLLNNLQLFSLERTPLSKIKESAPKYFDRVSDIARDFINKEEREFSKTRTAQAERSFMIADQFANQYEQTSLVERKNEALKLFIGGADYNTFVLSKLYDLAGKIQSIEKSEREIIFKKALEINALAKTDAHHKLLKSDLSKEHQGLVFEDIYHNTLKESSSKLLESMESKHKDKISDALAVINWNSKFEALKLAKSYKEIYVTASVKDPFSNGMYDVVKNYLTAKYLKEEIDKKSKSFIEREVQYLHINLYGKGRVSAQELEKLLL